MATERIRSYKRAFEDDFDCEDEHPHKVGLSERQKAWLVRAWTYMFGCVPNAEPDYSEQKGFHLHKGVKTQWHHVNPKGFADRALEEDPDVPENLVPLDETSHIGKGKSGDPYNRTDYVAHPDTMEAGREYRINQNAFREMSRNRHQNVEHGRPYQDTSYDEHYRDLASRVVNNYQSEHPEDKWPQVKHRK